MRGSWGQVLWRVPGNGIGRVVPGDLQVRFSWVWESTVYAGSPNCVASHSSMAPTACVASAASSWTRKGMSCLSSPLTFGFAGLLVLSSWPHLLSPSTSAGCAGMLVVGCGACGGLTCSCVGGCDHCGAASITSCASRACCTWVRISRMACCMVLCACRSCVHHSLSLSLSSSCSSAGLEGVQSPSTASGARPAGLMFQ